MVILCCPLIDNEQRLTLRSLLTLRIAQLALLYLYVITLGKPAQGLRICHLLMLHDETDGAASLATRETVAVVASRTDRERRCGIIMERT